MVGVAMKNKSKVLCDTIEKIVPMWLEGARPEDWALTSSDILHRRFSNSSS